MKILRNYLIQAFILLTLSVFVQSCSNSHKKTLDDKITSVCTNETEIIIAARIDSFSNEAEFTTSSNGHKQMPQYLRDALNRFSSHKSVEIVEYLFDNPDGIDFTELVLSAETLDSPKVLVFGVDYNQFVKSLKKDGTHVVQTDKIADFRTVCIDDNIEFLVKNGLGFVVLHDGTCLKGNDAASVITRLGEKAKKSPLAQWKKEYLSQPEILNILSATGPIKQIIDEHFIIPGLSSIFIKGDYIECSVNLDGATVFSNLVLVNNDGSAVKNDITGKFDAELMQYATNADFIGASLCLNSDGYSDLEQATFIPTGFLDDEGGIFACAGLKDNFSMLHYDELDTYHFVVAARLKPEKADEAYRLVCKLIGFTFGTQGRQTNEDGFKCAIFKVPYKNRFDYTANKWVNNYVDLRVGLDGNNLVISNSPVMKNSGSIFDNRIFANNAAGLQVVANANTVAPLRQFGLVETEGIELSITFNNDRGNAILTVTGTSEKFMPALFAILSKFGL